MPDAEIGRHHSTRGTFKASHFRHHPSGVRRLNTEIASFRMVNGDQAVGSDIVRSNNCLRHLNAGHGLTDSVTIRMSYQQKKYADGDGDA